MEAFQHVCLLDQPRLPTAHARASATREVTADRRRNGFRSRSIHVGGGDLSTAATIQGPSALAMTITALPDEPSRLLASCKQVLIDGG